MIDEKSIPQKSIFKSSEVCEIIGIKPYILRFWETEFIEIKPIVSSSGKKLFEKKDILLISIIKELLFSKKLTLEKAKFEITKIDLDKTLQEEVVEKSKPANDLTSVDEIQTKQEKSKFDQTEKDSCSEITVKVSKAEIELESENGSSNKALMDCSSLDPQELIELVPEIPLEESVEENFNKLETSINNECIAELNIALETIFEKSKLLKGQYQWI